MLPANLSRRLLFQASRGFVAKNVSLAFFSAKVSYHESSLLQIIYSYLQFPLIQVSGLRVNDT